MSTSFPILDLVIGLVFIFFLLSIITSSAVELVLTIFKARAKVLEAWLKSVFDATSLNATGQQQTGVNLGQAIMNHCLTTARSGKNKATPYMSASNFVSALLDKISIKPVTPPAGTTAPFQTPPADLAGYIAAITGTTVLSDELKRTFLAFAQEAVAAAAHQIPTGTNVTSNLTSALKSEMELFREKLEGWYDETKDRLTDKLKRGWTVWLTALFGTIVVISSNTDSIKISRYLYSHPTISKQFADSALANFHKYDGQIAAITARDSSMKAQETSPEGNTNAKPAKDIKGDSANQASANKPATNNTNTRSELVKDSVTLAQLNRATDTLRSNLAALKSEIPAEIPLGWKDEQYPQKEWWERSACAIGKHFFGWLATILAVMLGAPFWFDTLNKISNIRGTGPKPASQSDLERKVTGTDKS